LRRVILLTGNIDPIVMKDSSKEEVKKLCMETLEEIAPCGGFGKRNCY